MLYVTMIDQLGGIVFTSNKDVVIDTCKKLNWTHKNMLTKVKDHVFMRFNPITGTLVGDVIKCEPRRSEKSSSNKTNADTTLTDSSVIDFESGKSENTWVSNQGEVKIGLRTEFIQDNFFAIYYMS